MENNISCNIASVGKAKIKIYTELSEPLLWHETYSKFWEESYLFEYTLYLKGYKYTGEGKVLKGFKSALVVMKEQRKTDNLYVL